MRIAGIINALGPSIRHSIMPLAGDPDAAALIDPGISYKILPRPNVQSTVAFWIELCRALRSAKPSLLLTYNWGAIEAALAGRITSICPVIHNESGFGPDEAISLKRRRVWARRIILNWIHLTVVNSRGLQEIALKQYRIHPRKLRFIRNGIDVARFHPQPGIELRRRFGVTPDTVLFGYLGKFREEKNLPLLLRAFARADLANTRLALIGDGTGRQELASLAESLGIANRVIFTGHVEDTARFLQSLDVFVMSSVTEQTPNALLEAMACGLPVICTDVGDVRELLNAVGPPTVVPSGDVASYAAALTTMARDPGLRNRTGTVNRQRAIENYSLDRMVQEFTEVYRAAIG